MKRNRIEEELSLKEIDLSGKELLQALKNVFEIEFASGLPCGELREFIKTSASDPEIIHIQAGNERESVGIASGAWLGGKVPILYMQNSGLFEASNDLGSLMVASEIPAIFVVSWRGAPGETATQHLATGSATIPLIEAFGLAYATRSSINDLERLKEEQQKTSLPVLILKTREKFNQPEPVKIDPKTERTKVEVLRDEEPVHSREEVLGLIVELTPLDRALFSSTGLISRSLFHHSDSPNQFYNAGAFGLTSSIALGFVSTRLEVPVTIVEGDGSVLTNLGNLNLIGYQQPENFLHIVLDNKAYLSCSGEQTVGSDLIPDTAALFGYKNVFSVASLENIRLIMDKVNKGEIEGPVMLHIRINQEGVRRFDRPLKMSEIARRFKSHFE